MTTGDNGYSESLSPFVYFISNALFNAGYPRTSEDVIVIRDRWATRVRLEAADELARERICRSSIPTGNSLDP